MRAAQVFPTWVSGVKSKLGDKTQITPITEENSKVVSTNVDIEIAESTHDNDRAYLKAPRVVYKGHQMAVRSVGVLMTPNKDDTLIFSGSEDKLIFVWSLKTGEKIAELKGHTQRVTSIATLNVDGYEPLMISASWDERLRIWPMTEFLTRLASTDSVHNDTLSERVSSQSKVLKGHLNRIFSVIAVHRPGSEPFAASGSSDNTIRVWSLPEGKPLYVLEDEDDVTWNLCLTSWFIPETNDCRYQGTVLVSGCKNSTVRVWQHKYAADLLTSDTETPVEAGTMSEKETVKTRTTPDLVITGLSSSVHSVAAFAYQDHPLVATVCKDLDIRVFSMLTGALMKTLRGHTNFISAIAVSSVSNARGGAILVSVSREGANMRVWKYSTGECLRFFKGHTMDINAVEVFPTPDSRKDDLIIVSGSRDTTVRTWLFAEEKALKVLDHGNRVKIKGLDVYHDDVNSIVVTGADDGALRAWRTKRNEGEEERSALEWKVEKAHKHQVLALTIYTPLPDEDGYFAKNVHPDWPAYLHEALVFSAAREGKIRVTSMKDGKQVGKSFQAHDAVITSLYACAGTRSTIFNKVVDPFLVSGSEDNTAIVWSLITLTPLRVLEGHVFDVTAVSVFIPPPVVKDWGAKVARASNPPSRQATPRDSTVQIAVEPIVITGGMDNIVRLWNANTGDTIKVFDNADSHITCVAAINIEQQVNHAKFVGPIVAAGDGYGVIWIWALRAPYELLYALKGHADEIRSIYAFSAEGLAPVLVSGSLDCTVKVWNLETMKLHKTIEGHTADVTAVKIFSLGGSDLALVSASSDTTTRVVFEFMEAAPQYDVVMQLFQFDVNGTNSHVTVDVESAFPRIWQLSKKEGVESFFGTYYFLYGEALNRGRPEFLEEFLPLSTVGLLKACKYDFTTAKSEPQPESASATILRMALEKQDTRSLRCIVSCWCKFFSETTSELIHDEVEGRLSMEDMLALAEAAPAEFQRLVCSIKLIPTKDNIVPPGSFFLYERETDKKTILGKTPSEPAASTALKVAPALSDKTFLYLPLTNAVHMEMLYALTSTCEELDSVEIFNSDVGKLALSYAWRRMGLQVHLFKMGVYLIYVILSTTSLLTFSSNKGDPNTGFISYILIIVQLIIDAYFINGERQQFTVNPVEYLSDIWNALDFTVVMTNLVANILRLAFWHDTVVVQVLLCISSIVGYFNILYFLRAFEATGPLVSMILKISQDMCYLIVVVMIVLVGFSQAFWIVSFEDPTLPFGTIENSLLNSFVFMLGGYDPSAFAGTYLNRFAIAMSCLYMLIVSILLLNLLIALMGDSYGAVKEKGLAQWKLEQAQIITEMQGSMSNADRTCTAVVYFRTLRVEPEPEQTSSQEQLEQTVAEMKRQQKLMMKMLTEQQERMRQQMELNMLLREFLNKPSA